MPHHPTAVITILIENRAAREGLTAEHGFSAWIEAGSARVLFDTGQSGAVAANAAALGVDLSTTGIIALSHGHYDHTGGLPAVLALSPRAVIVMHPAAMQERYSIRPPAAARMIGIPRPARRAIACSPLPPCLVVEPVQLTEMIHLTGPIPRLTQFEDTGGPFFLDTEGEIADLIEDDQSLWIETPAGKVVVCGCAHAGIVNTLNAIQRINPATPVHAVIGGLHLIQADSERMAGTEKALEAFAPAVLAAGHCTGSAAMPRLAARFPESFATCRVGERFVFDGR